MKTHRASRAFVCLFLALLVIPQQVRAGDSKRGDVARKTVLRESALLSPSQQYAGEILAYLLKLVLGKAGDPGARKAWQTTGLSEPLDLTAITDRLTNPGKDDAGLLVLDPKILGLLRVLYHYDPQLNLNKTASSILSIYPAPEFVAMRLLLLQKIHRAEKISLGELVRNGRLLAGKEADSAPEDLKATGLTAEELKLLREIIAKEPHIYGYLHDPFLCKALYEVGAVHMDKFVSMKIRQATYRNYRCAPPQAGHPGDAVRILILPSFIGEFDVSRDNRLGSESAFTATELFKDVVERLQQDIRRTAVSLARKEIQEGSLTEAANTGTAPELLLEFMVQRMVSFVVQDRRPLVVHPDNARQVIQDVCPEAEFTVILLDKNIYLSIYFDEKSGQYPNVPWIYTDLMDVKYAQYQDQLDLIGRFIVVRLQDRAGKDAPKRQSSGDPNRYAPKK